MILGQILVCQQGNHGVHVALDVETLSLQFWLCFLRLEGGREGGREEGGRERGREGGREGENKEGINM